MRRARLSGLPYVFIERPDREVAVHVGAGGGGDEKVEVAQDQGRLGEDREGIARLSQRLDDPPREVVPTLGALVGVGVGPHGDVLAVPARRTELGPDALDGIHLDHEFAFEVLAHAEPEVFVGGTGEAVRAGVATPSVGVDGETEGHARRGRHLVDDPAGIDVEELEAPVFADAHVAIDELLLGEEPGLAAVVVGFLPPEGHGLAHGSMVSNIRSIRFRGRMAPPGGPDGGPRRTRPGETSRLVWTDRSPRDISS
jgi:hypothetical protein